VAVIDGDPFGGIKKDAKPSSPEPREVNSFHSRSDVDSSTTAQHHTLGVKHDQASPGDHNHDGKGSRKLGQGLNLSISGVRNSVASENSIVLMLQQVIEFTDGRTA
jgi:hypothetical protein